MDAKNEFNEILDASIEASKDWRHPQKSLFNQTVYSNNIILTNFENVLHHLSALLGSNITNYKSRYCTEDIPFNQIYDDGYICCSVEEKERMVTHSSQYILHAPSPSKIISAKWSTAFIPLSPVHYRTNYNSELQSSNKNSAKRDASLKRVREESGKFKRCQTKWVPATVFYNDVSASSDHSDIFAQSHKENDSKKH